MPTRVVHPHPHPHSTRSAAAGQSSKPSITKDSLSLFKTWENDMFTQETREPPWNWHPQTSSKITGWNNVVDNIASNENMQIKYIKIFLIENAPSLVVKIEREFCQAASKSCQSSPTQVPWDLSRHPRPQQRAGPLSPGRGGGEGLMGGWFPPHRLPDAEESGMHRRGLISLILSREDAFVSWVVYQTCCHMRSP